MTESYSLCSEQNEVFDKVSRQILRSGGINVEGKIQNIDVTFTADTGAIRTVTSPSTFKKILKSSQQKLQKSCLLAKGNFLKKCGKGHF